jgi:FixJ family two-component response regulator
MGWKMSEEGSSRGEIFVVDDDPAVRGTLSAILCRDGYEVVGFAEGTAFLGAARAREPACVLLDVFFRGAQAWRFSRSSTPKSIPRPSL